MIAATAGGTDHVVSVPPRRPRNTHVYLLWLVGGAAPAGRCHSQAPDASRVSNSALGTSNGHRRNRV